MTGKPVAKRLVFHIGGYDPITSDVSAQRRFVREIARFQRTWSVKAAVDGLHDTADQMQWNVTTTGPDWLVETDYRLVRWHDVIEAFGRRSIGSRISVGILAFLDFVLAGTLWRYLLTNWRYAGFFLYPFVMFGLLIAAAFLIGVFAFKITGSIPIATGGGLFGFAAVLAGPWRWLHLGDLFDDWIFSREYIRCGNSEIEQRLDRLATELVAAARNFAADEILVIGHSLGAVLAVDLLDRAGPCARSEQNSRHILECWIIHTQGRPAPEGNTLSHDDGTRRQVARDLLGRLSGPHRPVELLQKPANGRDGLIDRKRSDRQGR
jgi:hypothetical protein